MYCSDTRSENTGTLPISTPGAIVTSCSRTTRMGTSMPYGARNGLGPDAGRHHDGVRDDLGAVGQPHAGDLVTLDQQPGHVGALPNSHACGTCRHGEGLRGLVRVAVAAARLPRERLERRQVGERPQPGDLGGVDLLGLHTDGPLCGKAFAQRVGIAFAHPDDVSGLTEPDVGAEDLLGLLEHLEADGGHRGQRADAVVAAHDAAGLSGHAGADGIAFGDHDVGDAALRQRPGRGGAFDAAADDHHIRGTHRPGIQSVPASGTRAIAAASIVTATRSSGSRWHTCALPQARAIVCASIVSTRR